MRVTKAPRSSLERIGNGDRFERVFREFGRLLPWLQLEPNLLDWGPAAELAEQDDEFVLTAELPGVAREDIEIDVGANVLTLRAKKEAKREEKDRRYMLCERSYGEFQRSFTLPRSVEPDAIRADLRDGVLTVHLPKVAEARGRKIEIAEIH